jgi:hypothetical protein
MTASDELFQLIQSLSKSEKRYFRLFASMQKGEKNYLRIFDAIEKQSVSGGEYNENSIRKKFEKEHFIKHFPSEKNYLYNLILKILDLYQAENNGEIRISRLLNYANILSGKGLYAQSKKALQRAEQLAVSHENFIALLNIYKQQKDLFQYVTFEFNDFDKINASEESVFLKIKNIKEYEKIRAEVVKIFTHEGESIRNKNAIKILQLIVKNPLLKSEKMALSFRAKSTFYFINNGCYNFLNERKKALDYARKRVELIEKNPDKIDILPEFYINAINNYINSLNKLHKFKEAILYLAKMKSLAAKRHSASGRIFIRYCVLLREVILVSLDFEKMPGLIKDTELLFKNYKKYLRADEEIIHYYRMATLYVYNSEYSKALGWLNKLLNSDLNIREDAYAFARILNLIIHLELKNNEALEYFAKSAQRFLHKRKILYRCEEILIDFIKKISKRNDKDLSNEYRLLKTELTEVLRSPSEKKFLDYFDLMSWLDSKIENKNFTLVLKAKKKT